MPLEDEDLIFNGTSSTEAEKFVTWARRKARSEGKAKDQEWILELVSSSLGGNALRWYLALDSATCESWSLLQRAILSKWLATGDSDVIIPSARIPTPAAAPIPTPAISQAPTADTTRIGYIRAFGALKKTYLSRETDSGGDFLSTDDKANALRVKFVPGEQPHGIEVLNGPSGSHRWLGGWYRDLDPEFMITDYLSLIATTPPDQYPVSPEKFGLNGTAQCRIWNVCPGADGSIRMTWDNGRRAGSSSILSQAVIEEGRRWLFTVRDADRFMNRSDLKDIPYREVRLVFEPL